VRPMQLDIDHDSPVPIFEQIVDAVVEGIREGRLVVDQKLPTVRGLAGDLGVAVNTVAKAYRHLEEQGHVETRGRNGTFVRAEVAMDRPSHLAAGALAQAARQDGLDLEQTIGLLRRVW